MKKQLLLFILTLLPLAASAYDAYIDGFFYNFNTTKKTAAVTYYKNGSSNKGAYSGTVNIPSTVMFLGEEYVVKGIGDYAFQYCSDLTFVTIPNSITSIGQGAFEYCSGLTSVTIPNSVTSISDYTFTGCSFLTSITIPSSVTKINRGAFSGCSHLTSVIIGKSVTNISNYAFANCPNITDVTCLAESVPYAASDTFDESNIGDATLYVPSASVTAYMAAVPWMNFKSIVEVVIPQCATPTITVKDGKMTFNCETEGVTFKVSYIIGDNKEMEGNELILAGTTTAHVSVFATKEGYLDSDTVTTDVELNVGKKGDVNQDGVVSITDAVSVVNIILGE